MDSDNNKSVRITLGDFEIHEELGRGGMGVVYRARQISLNRIVALKVLKGSFTLLPAAVERFRREAAAAARLHHSSIVPIYATGSSDDQHFYAMELIEGFSLDKVLDQIQTTRQTRALQAKRTPLTAEEQLESLEDTEIEGITDQGSPITAGHDSLNTTTGLTSGRHYYDSVARIIADVADALDYAHKRGVVHRDIKPGNLILSNANHVYITDFGLARVQEEQGLTATGGVMGSPHYMSPEQVSPGMHELDHRSDIYSLGVTLYELITMQAPFKGVSKEMVMNHILTKEPKSPRKISRHIPKDIETISLKAMDKRPDRRYQTASELADDLRRYINRFAISARPVGLAERTLRWCQRHPSSTGTIAASLVALLALTGLWMNTKYQAAIEEKARVSEEAADMEKKLRREAEGLTAQAEAARQRADEQKYFRQYIFNINVAGQALAADDGPKAEIHLEQISSDLDGQGKWKGFEWGYLNRQAQLWQGTHLKFLTRNKWPLSGCDFSPDGNYLAASGRYGRIQMLSGMTDPNNITGDRFIELIPTEIANDKDKWVNQISFSPDGKLLATGSDDETIRLWTLATIATDKLANWRSKSEATFEGHMGPVYDVQFSPDSQLLASASDNGTVGIWDVEKRRLKKSLTGHTGRVRSVSFSTAGNGWLASAGDDGRIILWDAQTFEQIGATTPREFATMSVAFSPDGRTLASGGLDSTIRLWNPDGLQEIVPLNGHESGVIHVTFSPNGKFLASTSMDQTVRVWDVERRSHVRTFHGHHGKVWRSVFSPDGKGLVSVGHDGSANVWDLSHGLHVVARNELTIDRGHIWSCVISPDGTLLADIGVSGSGFVDKTLRLWTDVDLDAGTGQSFTLDTWTDTVGAPEVSSAFSPDNTQLVSINGGVVNLWDVASRKKSGTWEASTNALIGARFSPDGRQVAVWGKERFVRLFDIESQAELTALPAVPEDSPAPGPGGKSPTVTLVEYLPNGESLVMVESQQYAVRMWNLQGEPSSSELQVDPELADNGWVNSIAVSPDSSLIAAGDTTGHITIWNTKTHAPQATFKNAHRGYVNALAFLDDGKTLVSTSVDSTIKFWNLEMRQEVLSMDVLPAKGVLDSSGIEHLSATIDGRQLISVAGESRIRIWSSTK